MSRIVSDRAVLYAFKVEGGRPWYLLLRRTPDGGGRADLWETVVADVREGETSARAAIRGLDDVTSANPVSLWSVDHVETAYDHQADEMHVMPCFAALVSGEIRLGNSHDTSRWFSSTEVANVLRSAPRRASMDAVHHDVGLVVARGAEPDPRLRIV